MSNYILDFEAPLKVIDEKIDMLRLTGTKTGENVSSNIKKLEAKLEQKKADIYSKLSRWDRVQLARHPNRPHSLDYIRMISEDFFELHGDRYFAEDPSVVCGLMTMEDKPYMVIAQQKGRTTKENLYRNFGMSRPEGYRKALRIMKLAEKFNVPILTLIDTMGAYPGLGAEERGQAEAIARNLFEMPLLEVPIINLVIGEGASGGALGIGVGDRLFCQENTWFSVISPEGCASILYRDSSRAFEAADAMKVTAADLMEMGIADKIIPEPNYGAHYDSDGAAKVVKETLIKEFQYLLNMDKEELLRQRFVKYERIGSWKE